MIASRESLYEKFNKMGFKIGCEIGVHIGNNALSIFQRIPGVKLYLVEPYSDHSCSIEPWDKYREHTGSSHENAKKIAHKKLVGYNCEWLEMFSEDAVKLIEDNSLDFAHIDGEHTYDFIMLDTILWTRKVKVGGIVSGHDYDKPNVERAIKNYTEAHGIEFLCTGGMHPSWYFTK